MVNLSVVGPMANDHRLNSQGTNEADLSDLRWPATFRVPQPDCQAAQHHLRICGQRQTDQLLVVACEDTALGKGGVRPDDCASP